MYTDDLYATNFRIIFAPFSTSTYFELKESPVADVDLTPIIASPVVDINDTISVG